MGFDYWYDDYYGYDDYLSVDGLFGGLLDGIGSLFGGLIYDDYDYSYDDYGYDYYGGNGDEVISIDSSGSSDDYSLLDSIFGLFGGLTSYDDTLSVDGLFGGLFDDIGTLFGGLLYDDYGYSYDYGSGNDIENELQSGSICCLDTGFFTHFDESLIDMSALTKSPSQFRSSSVSGQYCFQ